MTDQRQDIGRTGQEMTPTLVLRLRLGDKGAGDLLNTLYRDALVRFCWGYLGRMDDAEDAVQDVCCRILAADTVPEAFRPWLYKTARNHCLNLLRARRRQPRGGVLPADSQIHETLTGHLTRLVRREQRARLSDLLGQLPIAQQEVLRLRYVEELPRAEIAEVLDMPVSLVKSRLFEGLKTLRDGAAQLEDS